MLIVLSSARRHRVNEDDMSHAIDNAVRIWDVDDERVIYVGPSRSGALLEVGAYQATDGVIVFHAMPCRTKYLPR